eukprot:5851932-Amphidinium_carterae.2
MGRQATVQPLTLRHREGLSAGLQSVATCVQWGSKKPAQIVALTLRRMCDRAEEEVRPFTPSLE